MTIGQYNVVTNVIKCHRITFCGQLQMYGYHGYHHIHNWMVLIMQPRV